MFHTCAIKGLSYRPVRAGRRSQPGGAGGPASQVSEARQKHLSLGTGTGGLALAQNIPCWRGGSFTFWQETVLSKMGERRTRL